jgi:hypothetical protein
VKESLAAWCRIDRVEINPLSVSKTMPARFLTTLKSCFDLHSGGTVVREQGSARRSKPRPAAQRFAFKGGLKRSVALDGSVLLVWRYFGVSGFLAFFERYLPVVPLQIFPRLLRRSPLPIIITSNPIESDVKTDLVSRHDGTAKHQFGQKPKSDNSPLHFLIALIISLGLCTRRVESAVAQPVHTKGAANAYLRIQM